MMQSLDPAQVIEQAFCSSGTFDVEQARKLLYQLKREVKEQHGIELNLSLVIKEAVKVMAEQGRFSKAEIETANMFYSQLLEPKVKKFNAHKSRKKKDTHKKKKSPELVLPDKMALGFVFILSGTLLCILPFGFTQGVGTGLVGTGLYAIADGAREGEKPYFVDSEKGVPIPPNNQTGSSVGIEKSF